MFLAIKCYECQDVPPLITNCSKMAATPTGVVLNDCAPDMDACQTIITRGRKLLHIHIDYKMAILI